jgi:RNA exonuclease 4
LVDVLREIDPLLKNKVLIGHGLENDFKVGSVSSSPYFHAFLLQVLLLNHPRKDIRDTSKYHPFRKFSGGRTPSLKRLAMEILGIEIQTAAHDSVTDSKYISY